MMMTHRTSLRYLLTGLLLATAALPAAVAAQTVVGTVSGEADDAPIRGALVHLEDLDGRRITSGLTGENGRFVLRTGVPGHYRLTVEMIGFRSVTTASFAAEAGETIAHSIRVSVEAVALAGIRAEGSRRCRSVRGAEGDLARLWEEARKGLHAVLLTEASPHVMFRTAVVERDLDPRTAAVLSEVVRSRRILGAYPFRSPNPHPLLEQGFIQVKGDSTVFIAPDARLLLSDEFLADYCFAIERGSDAAEVGLAFAPVRRGGPPSITGVLWIDAETAGLRRIEYRYNPTPVFPDARAAGGDMSFDQLANGAWIVRNWRIHAPRLTLHMPEGRFEVSAVRETVGRVVEVRGLGTRP
jgi:hypothetical protein